MGKISEHEKQEAREWLLEILKPGDTIYTVLRHVSRSGMFRVIGLKVLKDGYIYDISWQAAKLLEGYSDRYDGCKASGCGMDMGFHLVYNLSYELFKGGFQCIGENCPSNDHSNRPYPKRDGEMMHKESGYALNQRWM